LKGEGILAPFLRQKKKLKKVRAMVILILISLKKGV
jgi:hypothetical protein